MATRDSFNPNNMSRSLIYLTLFTLSIASWQVSAQGCSDAGFCTIDAFKPGESDSTNRPINQIKVGAFFGSADYSILVSGAYVEYNRSFGKKVGMDVKLTSLAQSGNDISVFGLSDLFLNAHYKLTDKLKMTLGVKIPLTKGDLSYNGLPLPMDYQASLGTFDLILGVGYSIKNLHFVAALQQPLVQNNNGFIASDYPLLSPLRAFQSTNKFIRKGDVLLRVSYPLNLTSKLKFTPSVLPIYHLGNDQFTDAFGQQQEITGSQGLTLNGNIYLDYAFDDNNILQLNMGTPFIVREARPDGLTRGFIANLEYRFKF